jgi:hypothetical protein
VNCYACDQAAINACKRCAKPYCDDHGNAQYCADCLKPASALPSFNLYRGALLAMLVGTALAVVLLIRFTDPASPRYPRLTEVYYVAEADSGRFWRVSAVPDDDAWTKAVLSADGGKTQKRAWPGFGDKVLMAPAAPITVAKPQVTVDKAADGRVTLHLAQAADSRDLRLSVESDTPVKAVTINGERLPMQVRQIKVRWSAPGEPVDIVLEAAPGAKLDLVVAEMREAWPKDAKPLPARPKDAMAWGGSDRTVDVHLSWLRRKLGETAKEPRYLQSVRGVGVRLVAPPHVATSVVDEG